MKCWMSLCAAALAFAHAAAAQPVPKRPENLLAEAAQGVGVRRCLPAVSRLSALAISGTRSHDILMDWDHAKPDDSPFFSLLGLSYGQQSAAATITVIPQGDGGCTISAERISVAPFACRTVAEVELKGYRSTALLPNFTVYTQPDQPGESVSLIESPPMCLVVRRHVQYDWKDPAAPPRPAASR